MHCILLECESLVAIFNFNYRSMPFVVLKNIRTYIWIVFSDGIRCTILPAIRWISTYQWWHHCWLGRSGRQNFGNHLVCKEKWFIYLKYVFYLKMSDDCNLKMVNIYIFRSSTEWYEQWGQMHGKVILGNDEHTLLLTGSKLREYGTDTDIKQHQCISRLGPLSYQR